MEFHETVLVVHGSEKPYHDKSLTTLSEVHPMSCENLMIYSTIIIIDFIVSQMMTLTTMENMIFIFKQCTVLGCH